jgi:hypothetical protein
MGELPEVNTGSALSSIHLLVRKRHTSQLLMHCL